MRSQVIISTKGRKKASRNSADPQQGKKESEEGAAARSLATIGLLGYDRVPVNRYLAWKKT